MLICPILRGNLFFSTFGEAGVLLVELNLVHYALDKLYEGKKGKIEFVLIAMQDEEQKVRDFIKKNGYTTPVYLLKEPLSEKFSIGVFPTTFIIGKDGQILKKDEGAADWNSQAVHSFIDKL